MNYTRKGLPEIRSMAAAEWPPNGKGELANALTELLEYHDGLYDALRFLVDAAETEPGMAIYRAHLDKAKLALAVSAPPVGFANFDFASAPPAINAKRIEP